MNARADISRAAQIDLSQEFTARELAEMKLPGAPGTARGIKKTALREGWKSIKRSGKGGGESYPITALPAAWQAVILRPAIAAVRAQNAPLKAGKTAKIAGHAAPASIAGNIMGHITAKQRAARVEMLDTAPLTPALSHQPSPEGYGPASEGRGGRNEAGAAIRGAECDIVMELPGFRPLSAAQEARVDARMAVLGAFEAWWAQSGMGLTRALKTYCALYNDGDVALEGRVLAAVPTLSVNSLRAWAKKARTHGAARLAGEYGHRKGTGVIARNPVLLEFCAAEILDKTHLTATRLADAIEAEHGLTIPHRTVQRWMNDWRRVNAGILLHVSNPDAHRSHRGVGFGSQSERLTGMNQRWEIDATPADVMLTDGRHSVVGVIDVYTRRAMCLVTKTPRAVANTALLRRAILEWGLPESLKSDNGSDFTAKHMVRALRDLNIRHELCPPFTPQAKPHIERFFGTLTQRLFEILPGFIGHNVADRKAIECRRAFADRLGESGGKFDIAALTAEELQNYINVYLENDYHHTVVGGREKTPFEMWTQAVGSVRRVADARALDMLLAPAPDGDGFRVVGKKGVSVKNYFYVAPELGALVGERVHVRMDAADAGRIFCYALDGGFICVAECPEMTGISLAEVAMMAGAAARAAHSEGRKYVRAVIKAHRPDEMAARLLAHRVAKHANLIGFPKPALETTTPALLSAGEAAEALENFGKLAPPAPMSEDDRARASQAMAQMNERRRVVALRDNPPAGEAHFRDGLAFARWGLERIDELDAGQMEYLDEVLLGSLRTEFPAEAVAAARARQMMRPAKPRRIGMRDKI